MPIYRESLALTWTDLAGLLHHLGRNVDAEKELTKALPIFTRLTADFPQVPHYQEELAAGRDVLGQVLGELGRGRRPAWHSSRPSKPTSGWQGCFPRFLNTRSGRRWRRPI